MMDAMLRPFTGLLIVCMLSTFLVSGASADESAPASGGSNPGSSAVEPPASPAETGAVQERGLQSGAVSAPPYSCGSGVCLCVGQDNCNQMTQPQPCKREKFCLGQTASPPPPLPPHEPAFAQRKPPSVARTTTGSILICSCRSGQ